MPAVHHAQVLLLLPKLSLAGLAAGTAAVGAGTAGIAGAGLGAVASEIMVREARTALHMHGWVGTCWRATGHRDACTCVAC